MSKKPIVNIAELELREHGRGANFEARLGRIGSVIGAIQLGVQYTEISPGKAAFPRHAHHANEEMFVVLEGEGTYIAGTEHWPIRVGDVICARAGDGSTAHQVRNTSNADLKFLAISTRHDPDVVEYPDSGKFAVASMVPPDKGLLGARIAFIGRKEDTLDYWDGEPDGSK